MLRAHSWPGNVRELRNVMNRSALFCTGTMLLAEHLRIEAHDLTRTPPSAAPPSARPADDKRARVLEALERARWNQARAAEQLGVSVRTLYTWTNELGIARSRPRPPEVGGAPDKGNDDKDRGP